ncbi:MAG TPA: hypothetical protein PLL08_03800 [Bacteroidales bacterium]|nr:hypothetical protein [Bacteroidales bacterium]
MPRSLALTGRRPVPSPRAQAVGTQGGKKSLQARFFAAASPAASALAGFPPKRLTQPTCSCRNIKFRGLYAFWEVFNCCFCEDGSNVRHGKGR